MSGLYLQLVPKCPALKRIDIGEFFRSAHALLPRMNAEAPTGLQVLPD
jgi:hypothetical protein